MKFMKKAALIALVCGATGFMGACSSDDDSSSSAETINIALVLPYSADYASRGKAYENAVTMAVEDLMAGGFEGATGKKFKFTLISSGNGEAEVKSELQKAFDANRNADGSANFAAVISSTGAAQSGSTQIAAENKVPHFETSFGSHYNEFVPAAVPEETQAYMFSTRALCLPEAIVTADYIAAKFPTGKIAMFRGNKTHDQMHTDQIRQRLADIGWQGTLLTSDETPAADPVFGENKGDYMLDYESGVFDEKIKAVLDAEAPDHIFWHLTGDNHNLRFLQDAKRAGFEGDLITCGMARNMALLDPDQNGAISDYLENRLYFAMRAPIPSPDLTAFNTRYKETFTNFSTDAFTSANYDAMMLVGLAVVDAHPATDGNSIRESINKVSKEGTKHTFNDIGAAVSDLARGTDVDYDGPSGPLDISESRITPGSFYMEVAGKKADGTGLEYQELAEPIGRVIRVWDEVE